MRPIARRLWKGFSYISKWLRVPNRYNNNSVIVLMYHGVSSGKGDHINIPLKRFKKDIEWLDSNFEIIDLVDIMKSTKKEGIQIALTFDDGFRNFYTNALPILEEKEIPATVFINSGLIGSREDKYPKMTEKQIREVVENSCTSIGNHTRNHVDLTKCDLEKKRKEIIGGKEDIEEVFGIETERFAYPWGSHDRESVKTAGQEHEYCLITGRRHVPINVDRRKMPRISGDTPEFILRWDISDAGKLILPLLSKI